MDRIIEVKVGGNYITKDNKNAGVRGEANVTKLRITFDEGWDNFAKKVTFWDARGLNPVVVVLTADLLEQIIFNKRVYIVPIPAEPLAEAGMMTFVIDGYLNGKRQRSISDKLEVKDAPMAENAGQPSDVTPTQAEQLQGQIEEILGTIGDAVEAKEAIEGMTVSAETLSSGEEAFVEKSDSETENGVKTTHLKFGLPKGDNGDSGVYIGLKEPPEDKKVWIFPDGEPFSCEMWTFKLKDGTVIKRNVWVYFDDAPEEAEEWEFELTDGTLVVKKVVCL